jgi:hypothetical protein
MMPLTFPVQDTILRYQNNILFALLNPENVQWIYDSEVHAAADQELFTLPEMMDSLTKSIWSEVGNKDRLGTKSNTREPMISNMRRNVQRAYLGRLITVATDGEDSSYPAVARTLAWMELKTLGDRIETVLTDNRAKQLDPYTMAHLEESRNRIRQALEASFTIGGNRGGGGGITIILNANEPGSPGAINVPELLSSPSGRGGY